MVKPNEKSRTRKGAAYSSYLLRSFGFVHPVLDQIIHD